MACSRDASTVAQLQGADQNVHTGWRVKTAYETAGLTQRELAALTDISQRPLSWIVSGDSVAKTRELVAIARAAGISVSELTGSGAADRVLYAARAAEGSRMTVMRDKLLQFVDLNAYLKAHEI